MIHLLLALAMCQGGRFQPCVCWQQVPKTVQYRPAHKQCNGNAAVILKGKYARAFSVVVRDKDNRDRWPDPNCESNKCSVFKVQKRVGNVHCLGAPGRSPLFKNVVRITIKLKDVPGSNTDPLERMCLQSPTKKLN